MPKVYRAVLEMSNGRLLAGLQASALAGRRKPRSVPEVSYMVLSFADKTKC